MLSELLQKLEAEHGIDPAQGTNILNTIAQHIKEKFPMVGGMIDNLFAGQGTTTTSAADNTNVQSSNNSESTLQQLEDMAKSKLGGLFGN